MTAKDQSGQFSAARRRIFAGNGSEADGEARDAAQKERNGGRAIRPVRYAGGMREIMRNVLADRGCAGRLCWPRWVGVVQKKPQLNGNAFGKRARGLFSVDETCERLELHLHRRTDRRTRGKWRWRDRAPLVLLIVRGYSENVVVEEAESVCGHHAATQ